MVGKSRSWTLHTNGSPRRVWATFEMGMVGNPVSPPHPKPTRKMRLRPDRAIQRISHDAKKGSQRYTAKISLAPSQYVHAQGVAR